MRSISEGHNAQHSELVERRLDLSMENTEQVRSISEGQVRVQEAWAALQVTSRPRLGMKDRENA